MRTSSLHKKGKSPQAKLETKLWDLCRKIIRAQYPNVCYTCDQTGLKGSNWHTGHMWPKGSLHALLKYDLRILRPQCYNCNINHGGMGAVFHAKMQKEMGMKYMSKLEADKLKDKNETLKSFDHYTGLVEKYEKIANAQ